MMYFDIKATNLQKVLEMLPIRHDAGVTILQKVLKHIPNARALSQFGMSFTV